MDKIKNLIITEDTQFAILGMGRFGSSVAKVLIENGHEVLCCDSNPIVVHEAATYATHVIQADVTDESVLESIGLNNFDVVIVALSHDFEASIMTTMIAKEKGVPFVLAKATGMRQKKILENVGADRVVFPEKEIGQKIAYEFIFNDPVEHINASDRYDIIECSPKLHWVSKSIKELRLRQKEGINVLGILRAGEFVAVLDPETKIEKDDRLIILELL